METAIIYINHDNTLDLVLVSTAASGAITYVDADTFTRFTMETNGVLVDSDVEGFGPGDLFDTVDVTIGTATVVALRMKLGQVTGIPAGSYKARLVGYNTDNPNGLVWQDRIPLKFVD